MSELERFVVEHPLRERAVAALMVGRYLQGRQAEALAGYGDARRHLAEELGLDPSPILCELERQILCHGVSLPRRTVRAREDSARRRGQRWAAGSSPGASRASVADLLGQGEQPVDLGGAVSETGRP